MFFGYRHQKWCGGGGWWVSTKQKHEGCVADSGKTAGMGSPALLDAGLMQIPVSDCCSFSQKVLIQPGFREAAKMHVFVTK